MERKLPLSKDGLLGEVMTSMKSCQKSASVMCLRVINSLVRDKLLAEGELAEIVKQVN